MIFLLCSCDTVSLDEESIVKLVFHHNDTNVETQLSIQESEIIIDIIDGKRLYQDNPSCGFSEDISLVIDGKIYSPACDDCCIIKDCSSGKYFSISRDQRETIEEIFESYGGYFPCV